MIHFSNLSDEQIDIAALDAVGREILEEEGVTEDEEINCILTGNAHIQQLNKQYRERAAPTDVLAFSFAEGEDATFRGALFGDIYISVEMARTNAEEYAHRFEDEILLLFIHGLLHLLGYRDETGEERKKMREKEQHYLSSRGR